MNEITVRYPDKEEREFAGEIYLPLPYPEFIETLDPLSGTWVKWVREK
jgi:hypothetical protein